MSGSVAEIMIESGIEKVLVDKECFALEWLEIKPERGKAIPCKMMAPFSDVKIASNSSFQDL